MTDPDPRDSNLIASIALLLIGTLQGFFLAWLLRHFGWLS